MTPAERIEEAHGLWELSIVRLAAFAEVLSATNTGSTMSELLADAVKQERAAYATWREVSVEAVGP